MGAEQPQLEVVLPDVNRHQEIGDVRPARDAFVHRATVAALRPAEQVPRQLVSIGDPSARPARVISEAQEIHTAWGDLHAAQDRRRLEDRRRGRARCEWRAYGQLVPTGWSDVKLIALSGLITGIAASMSMAASEYLSTRSENTDKHPVRAAIYTGIAYIGTVILLVLPYLLFANYYLDLGIALTTAVIIIAVFNYYISVAKDESFRERFLEMAGLSLSVALFSFVIGYFIRIWLGIEV